MIEPLFVVASILPVAVVRSAAISATDQFYSATVVHLVLQPVPQTSPSTTVSTPRVSVVEPFRWKPFLWNNSGLSGARSNCEPRERWPMGFFLVQRSFQEFQAKMMCRLFSKKSSGVIKNSIKIRWFKCFEKTASRRGVPRPPKPPNVTWNGNRLTPGTLRTPETWCSALMGCKEHFKWINHEHVVTSPRIYGVKIYKSIQGFRGGGGLNLGSFFRWKKRAMEVFVHPGRLTWNIIMEAWKIIFLSKWVICRFYVNLPGWKLRHLGRVDHKLQLQGAVSQNHNMLIDPQQMKTKQMGHGYRNNTISIPQKVVPEILGRPLHLSQIFSAKKLPK